MAGAPMGTQKKKSRRWRDYLRMAIRQRDTPDRIARGVAIGMFIAFTPFFGLHIVLALIATSLLGGNRIASIPPLFITNVFTIAPVYAFTYWLGSYLVPGVDHGPDRAIAALTRPAGHGWSAFNSMWRELMEVGGEFLLYTTIGGAIVGAILAVPSFYMSRRFILRHRAHRSLRLAQRARDRAAAPETTNPGP